MSEESTDQSCRRGLPKRRKTSGVRDFPAGCGTKLQAPSISSSPRKMPAGFGDLPPNGSSRISGNLTAFIDGIPRKCATATSARKRRVEYTDQKQTYSLCSGQRDVGGDLQGEVRVGSSSISRTPVYPQTATAGSVQDACFIRRKVLETLQRFRSLFKQLSQEGEKKTREGRGAHRRVDYEASKILKAEGRYINTGNSILGVVPGVEVGDRFCYMVELNMVGLHRPTQGGIDYLRVGDRILATSVVSSGNYGDRRSSDVLMYTGQGGNIVGRKMKAEDQKLERGNLALANSKAEGTPVRVILGRKFEKDFVYDGLYLVEDCRRERGPRGKLVFKFKLVKMKDQMGRTAAITGKSWDKRPSACVLRPLTT